MNICIVHFLILFSLATNVFALFNDMRIINNLFQLEMTADHIFDLIFCGEFIHQEVVQENLIPYFDIAMWSMEAFFNVSSLTEETHSQLFFFTPLNEDILIQIIDKVIHFNSRNSTTKSSRRIFLAPWPYKENTPEEIFTYIQNNQRLLLHLVHIRQDSEVYILIWASDASGVPVVVDIIELFGIRGRAPVVQTTRGLDEFLVNSDREFQIDSLELSRIAARRRDFKDLVFNVVAQEESFYEVEVDVRVDENGSVFFASGTSYLVLQDLMNVLNFRHNPVKGEGWITLENGTLTGMGAQIMDRKADLGISTSTMEDYRAAFINFLQPIGNEQSFVFFRQPPITAARNIFMMPFQANLWSFIIISWMVTMICGFIIAFRKPNLLWHAGTSRMYSRFRPRQVRFRCRDAYIWTVGVACQQGWFGSPIPMSLRILFIISLFSNLMIYAYYTAAFVAAISAPTTPVKTYQDLFKNQFQVFANPSNPGYIRSFTKSDDEKNKILSASAKWYGSDTESVDHIMVSDKGLAAIMGQDGFYSVGLEKYSVTELCEVDKKKGNDGPKVKDAMIIRKGSPYKEYFGHTTVVLIERGLAKRYWTTYEKATQIRCLPPTNQALELSFLDCYTAFVILFFGQLLAFAWTFFERQHKCGLSRATWFPSHPSNY